MADSPGNGTEDEKRETKSVTISVKLTPTQKKRLEFVATLHGCDVGPMLYERTLNDILEEYDQVKERLAPLAVDA